MLEEFVDPPLLHSEPFDIERVTDQLATRGYACVDGLLAAALLESLAAELRAHEAAARVGPAGVGRGDELALRERVRNDLTRWLDGATPTERQFLDVLEQLRLDVNRRLLLGLFDVEAHFAVYHPGAYYQRHLDSFRGARGRLLTLVLYLNRDWRREDGGELLMFAAGEGQDEGSPAIARMRPEWGKAVIFLSEEIPHEVRPTNRTRYSIACWFRCRQGA